MRRHYLEITFRKGKPLAAYLYLSSASGARSLRTEPRDAGLLVDFDPEDRPIGIEITAPEQTTTIQINEILHSLDLAPMTEEDLSPLLFRRFAGWRNVGQQRNFSGSHSAGKSKLRPVFRIHIRPIEDSGRSFEYCRSHGVLGMGWAVKETGKSCLSWDEYIAAAKKEYNNVWSVHYLKREVEENDLIWTCDMDGRYYLGRVTSPWEYLANEESLQANIVNFCRCELFSWDIDKVPGKVIASFRLPRTIQAVRNQTVAIYSQLLWNRLSNTEHYSPEPQALTDIYALLDDQATRDAMATYLKTRGWLLLPESRKKNTMGYEYTLNNRETSERAVVQIKTRRISLNRDILSYFGEKVFLFHSYGNYTETELEYKKVECIDPDELRSFIFSNRELLPQSIKHWVDFMETKSITY